MRHLGQLSRRSYLILGLIALALDLSAFLGLDIGIGPHPLWSRIEDDTIALVGGYFLSLLVVVIAFYLIEILRDLIRWK